MLEPVRLVDDVDQCLSGGEALCVVDEEFVAPTLHAGGILDGDVNPTSAFMTGKLSVDGDMGQAMKLGAALS